MHGVLLFWGTSIFFGFGLYLSCVGFFSLSILSLLLEILVLVLLDAMESGSGAWKFHLEGAKNLLRSRQDSMSDSNMRRIVEGLDTFVIDSCLM